MKKLLLLSLVVTALFQSGFGQCTPQLPTGVMGFCPRPGSFPCIQRGVPFSDVIHFENWDSIGAIVIQSLRIDSFTNLPTGISYTVNPMNAIIPGGGTGCIEITGLTNDTVGTYQLGFYITVTLVGLGSFSGELSEIIEDMISLVILDTSTTEIFPEDYEYYVRVINQGGQCAITGSCNSDRSVVAGKVFYDANGNGVEDAGDNPMQGVRIVVDPISRARYTNEAGLYFVSLESGTYTVSVDPNDYFSVSTPVSGYQFTLGNTRNDTTGNDFGITPNTIYNDVTVSLTSGVGRPGFATSHWINYQNVGTSVQSGTITYSHNPILTFDYSNPAPATQNANVLTWSFSNLYPGQQEMIYVALNIPPDTDLLGDTLISAVNIVPVYRDTNLVDNKDTTNQIIVGSYDPNDKQVSPDDIKSGVRPGQFLTYTVRFQNTGTDTAFKVVIRDTLDNFLDGAAFKTIAASHPYYFELENNKYGIWTFDHILLPDSGIDEPSSHGFVKYAVQIKNNAPEGTRVKNSASIYFDFNDPVKTNTVESRVDFNIGIRERDLIETSLFPNPTTGAVTLTLSKSIKDFDVQILDISGKIVYSRVGLSGEQVQLDVKGIENGVYLYRILKDDASIAKGKLTVLK